MAGGESSFHSSTAFIRYLAHDAGTGAQVALLTGHTERISSIGFSPDGLTLASGLEPFNCGVPHLIPGVKRD